MNRYRRTPARSVGLLLFTALLGACSTLPVVTGHPDFSGVDAVLEDEIGRGRIPFAEVLAFNGTNRIYHFRRGYIDAARSKALPRDALYRIASLSKPITSIVALRLIEAGRMGLDDPVSKYLPEFSAITVRSACDGAGTKTALCSRYATKPVTVRHLLAHTAGISYPLVGQDELSTAYRAAGLTNGAIETPYSLDELPSRVAGLPLANEPGAAWRYGLATDVVGRLLEVVTGSRLSTILDELLLSPLGMHDTHFVVPPSQSGRLVPIFEFAPDDKLRPIAAGPQIGGAFEFSGTYPSSGESGYLSGGGGIVTTARDLGIFVRMLAAGGVHEGTVMLSPELFDEFRRDQTAPFGTGIDGTGFGLGIGVRTADFARGTCGRVGELFWSGIFFTTLWVDPTTRRAGIFLSQMRPDHRGDTARRVQNAVFEAFESVETRVNCCPARQR